MTALGLPRPKEDLPDRPPSRPIRLARRRDQPFAGIPLIHVQRPRGHPLRHMPAGRQGPGNSSGQHGPYEDAGEHACHHTPYLTLELLIGRLPTFHDTIDPSGGTIERGPRGIEHAPILGADYLGGEVDLLGHFGGRQRDGWCLLNGGEPGTDIAEGSVDAIERGSVIGNSLARGRQIGDGIMQKAELVPHSLEGLGSGHFGVGGFGHGRQARPCSIRVTRGWNLAGSGEICGPVGTHVARRLEIAPSGEGAATRILAGLQPQPASPAEINAVLEGNPATIACGLLCGHASMKLIATKCKLIQCDPFFAFQQIYLFYR